MALPASATWVAGQRVRRRARTDGTSLESLTGRLPGIGPSARRTTTRILTKVLSHYSAQYCPLLTYFEAIRVEWCKARARRTRWGEEIVFLKEEARRVLRSLRHDEGRWRARAMAVVSGEDPSVSAGRRAYALKQADHRARLAASFRARWLRNTPSRGQVWTELDQQTFETMQEALQTV